MTTSDGAPPPELRGPLGQVMTTSGGVVPLLAPAPAPYAVTHATPGLATAAAAPVGAPTLPSSDPGAMAVMIAGLANQLYGASPPTSVAPVPAPGNLPTAATATAPPTAGFAAPSAPFGGVPDLAGLLQLAPPTAIDAPPSYLATERRHDDAPRFEAHQLDATPPSLLRDLRGPAGRGAFDPHAVRKDFPILEERVHGKRLVWLDNGATTQKPRAVIDRLSYFYQHENSNIHRGAHTLAARATDAYEKARDTTRRFLNAPSTSEIVFVRGATEGINLVAQSWGRRHLEPGDEIVITHLEHHANIVPWQQLCAEKGARLKVAPVDDRGAVRLDAYDRLLGSRTKLVAFTQVSNALGTVTPAQEMVALAHRHGARVLVDGAQAVSHMAVDVQRLDCDYYVFSGHKVFAPTGIGVVYGKREVLASMPPWQGGGNMIEDVTFERTTYQPPPARFEAGTGNIADAVGLGAALDYVMQLGLDNIARYEHELLDYATAHLATVPGLTLVGTAPERAGVLSFVLDGQRTEDVGAALDREGIAVRSGHHCAQPILRRFGYEATVRASLAFYNTTDDLDALVAALRRLQAGRGFPQ